MIIYSNFMYMCSKRINIKIIISSFVSSGKNCSIINLSSISGHRAQPNRWTYSATKGAILSMTRCMALDLRRKEIRVNTVSPSYIWTPEVSLLTAYQSCNCIITFFVSGLIYYKHFECLGFGCFSMCYSKIMLKFKSADLLHASCITYVYVCVCNKQNNRQSFFDNVAIVACRYKSILLGFKVIN